MTNYPVGPHLIKSNLIGPQFISFCRCTLNLVRDGLCADGTAVDMHNIKFYFTYD